jgi:hypothetical protein
MRDVEDMKRMGKEQLFRVNQRAVNFRETR